MTIIQRFRTVALSIVWLAVLQCASVFAQSSSALPATADQVRPLLIGSALPKINLTTIDNQSMSLQSFVAQKPTIILAYRGGWCPFCNLHLSAVGEVEKDIIDMGYQILAVSPDAPSRLQETRSQKKLNYTLVSDATGAFARQAGIAFQVPKNYEKLIKESSGGINNDFLPAPAVFIADTKGVVRFVYVNPDFKHRISKEMLMGVIRALRSEKL